jgi:hypothetical protein
MQKQNRSVLSSDDDSTLGIHGKTVPIWRNLDHFSWKWSLYYCELDTQVSVSFSQHAASEPRSTTRRFMHSTDSVTLARLQESKLEAARRDLLRYAVSLGEDAS